MTLTPDNKILCINLGLLLGLAAILLRGYLPVVEEISLQNQQLKHYERQIAGLKAESTNHRPASNTATTRVFALPQDSMEHLSQELEVLARKEQMTFIQVEPNPEQAESVERWKVKITPYTMGFAGKDPLQFANLLTQLESQFPEFGIKTFTYRKEVGTIEALLLTSNQSIRLFTP